MTTNNKMIFNLYRYQILPINRRFQGSLFGDIKTIGDLIEKKNDLFYAAIVDTKHWKPKKGRIIANLEYDKDSFLLFRLAPQRTAEIEDESFHKKQINTYPSIYVSVWNDKTKQIIAVQNRKQSFADPLSVVNILVEVANKNLGRSQLKMYTEPIFNKEAFWNIVKKYEKKIVSVKFELITPNMANLSSAFSEDLKSFAKDTNASKTLLEIKSESGAPLSIREDTDNLVNTVNYASGGGGNISIKVKNYNRRIQTNKSVKVISAEELAIIGGKETAAKTLKALIEREVAE